MKKENTNTVYLKAIVSFSIALLTHFFIGMTMFVNNPREYTGGVVLVIAIMPILPFQIFLALAIILLRAETSKTFVRMLVESLLILFVLFFVMLVIFVVAFMAQDEYFAYMIWFIIVFVSASLYFYRAKALYYE